MSDYDDIDSKKNNKSNNRYITLSKIKNKVVTSSISFYKPIFFAKKKILEQLQQIDEKNILD